ncbi:MAG: hypothetical protein IPM21_12045 [Acidobacteria bacterium]|nr:hypothetical protein [Acidobacteriota bacterium]
MLQGQQLPPEIKNDRTLWAFDHIRDWEQHLYENGAHPEVLCGHLCHARSRRKRYGPIEEPEKNCKFSAADVREHGHWDDYEADDGDGNTSTDHAPWYVVPADKKWIHRLAVSEIIVKSSESMNLHYPKVSEGTTCSTRRSKIDARSRTLIGGDTAAGIVRECPGVHNDLPKQYKFSGAFC